MFSVGDDPDCGESEHRAMKYRDRGNRSLSGGDVVAIDGRFDACIPTVGQPIDPSRQVRSSQPGITPLY